MTGGNKKPRTGGVWAACLEPVAIGTPALDGQPAGEFTPGNDTVVKPAQLQQATHRLLLKRLSKTTKTHRMPLRQRKKERVDGFLLECVNCRHYK